jgi:hypothetical protein
MPGIFDSYEIYFLYIEVGCIGLQNRDYGRRGSVALTMRHSFIRKSWH